MFYAYSSTRKTEGLNPLVLDQLVQHNKTLS